MRPTSASDGWSTKPGFESYFHPFASMLDNLTMTQFVHNAHVRANGADVSTHPNRFFSRSGWHKASSSRWKQPPCCSFSGRRCISSNFSKQAT